MSRIHVLNSAQCCVHERAQMMKLRILYQDDFIVVIDKPAGIQVHPPEDPVRRQLAPEQPDVVRVLRQQCGKRVYPVHRLDRATSGVLVMAFDSRSASRMQDQFKSHGVTKNYIALVRGFTESEQVINSPLTARLDGGPEKEAITHLETLCRFELPIANSRYSTSRFSIVSVYPQTGRLHQIRRHLKRKNHPIIGDTVHGDGVQNRIWRQLTEDKVMYLKAYALGFSHPESDLKVKYRSRFSGNWQRVFDIAGVCPYLKI